MCTKCVMIRCAAMQSTLLRYMSSKYYYSIKKSYDNFIDFKAVIFNFFVPKESFNMFKNDSSTSTQILLWGVIHA